jgi:hypothetical protein
MKEKLCERRRNRQSKNITMTREGNKRKSFGKYISGRYLCSRERASLNEATNKMMADIDVFGTRGNGNGV